MANCRQLLDALKDHALPEAGLGTPKRGTPAKNSVRFDARASLFEASGVDQAFHLLAAGLCPGTKISGGKVLSSATKPCANRAAQALRMAAQALRKSQTALGAHHPPLVFAHE